ncbi:hypothetical protein, partial [Salmonella sp. zj-f50]|uniref:hypothetical protein n=1 Tax=Salmonella sp. zj-f50 TaxID=2582616 RepID=UPI001DE40863
MKSPRDFRFHECTFIVALIMAVLDNGLRMAGVAQEWQIVGDAGWVRVCGVLEICGKRYSGSGCATV